MVELCRAVGMLEVVKNDKWNMKAATPEGMS